MKYKNKISRFLPYSRQFIDGHDILEVKKNFKKDFITQGPKINEFEKFCKICGQICCCLCHWNL